MNKKNLIIDELEDKSIKEEIDELIETEKTGVIYCLTNKINGKKYVGQAKSYVQNHAVLKQHGLNGRFKDHCRDANRKTPRESCPKFYSALRKYGADNFDKEVLGIFPLEELDDREEDYIRKYDTVNNGYNINYRSFPRFADDKNKTRIEKIQQTMIEKWKDPEYINKTVPANLKAVQKRADEGKTRKSNKELPPNIYKTETGYDIRILRNGKYKITSVMGKDLSDEELLDKAVKKRDEILHNIENGIDDSLKKQTDHNGNPLPKGITNTQSRGNKGYRVTVRLKKNGKEKRKEANFIDKNKTMDEKLELAKKALIDMSLNKKDIINKEKEDRLDHNNNILPPCISITKKKGKIIGYQVNIKNTKKSFCVSTDTMDERLEKANKYLTQTKGQSAG